MPQGREATSSSGFTKYTIRPSLRERFNNCEARPPRLIAASMTSSDGQLRRILRPSRRRMALA
jgi:hypothetical protein